MASGTSDLVYSFRAWLDTAGDRAEEILEVVGVVDTELDHRPTRALVGEPAPGVGGQLQAALVGEVGLCQRHLSDLAGLDPLLHRPMPPEPSSAVTDCEWFPGCGRRPRNLTGVFHRVGYRLVGVDGLARIEALEDDALVRVIRRGDHHALDLRVGEQLVEGGCRSGNPELRLESGATLG